MAGVNKVILIGHIGKDPDVFTYEDGTKRISFPLATTESYRDKNTNEWVDQTEWHNIVGYRYLAEKRIAKGDLIYVEGKIKTRKYKDKDGNDRYITEILAEKINMMAHPKGYDGGSSDTHSATPKNSQTTATDSEKSTLPEDDLPF
ncbi:MAG: single-stranded DNA-binding protein [Lentimicrobiaceae bacterium]|jgi:single-strand DNA-binding protein|nr:single-stranded DNA-binding protein [Lentimicrobiaceae bacterium]MCP4910937.1 single-stranded DNA-binding protein [Bacteroidota bacterium]MBT3455312.1 single-stranded DNA-binding protein [Lentimicrobiaceae bacterium]MBT3818848.1 single-stranded DNA-binding protein [Lentimicrobiaceae bacterium]MBT4062115.1 single-stranded DNA-binding protein [Lentimicrobiaceae bacterium]